MGTTSDTGRGLVEDTLEHFGIKGMRWGVRRSNSSGGTAAVTVKVKKGKGVVKTSGGKGRSASEDAVAKAAARQKGKASTVDALTNQELKTFVERKKLEEQYMSYVSKEVPRKSKGRKFIEGVLKQEVDAVKSGKTGPILKTAATAATVATTIGALTGNGKHRGTMKLGALTVATLAGGPGKHRK